jgi:hypothetical protein
MSKRFWAHDALRHTAIGSYELRIGSDGMQTTITRRLVIGDLDNHFTEVNSWRLGAALKAVHHA